MTALARAMALVVLAGWARSARADDEEPRVRARLSVERGAGAEGCLDAAELAARVERRLGRDVFPDGLGVDVAVVVRVAAEPAGLVARLEMTVEGGEVAGTRTIAAASRDCRRLDEALALVTALLVDLPRRDIALRLPATAEGQPGSRPAGAGRGAGAPDGPPPRRGAPARPGPPRRRAPPPLALEVAASVATVAGWLPDPTVGGRFAVGVRWGAVRVALGASAWVSQRRSITDGPRAREGRFELLALTPAADVRLLSADRVEIAAGAHLTLARLRGVGVGFDADGEAVDWGVAPGLHGRVGLRLGGPAWAEVEAGVSIAGIRPRFGYLQSDGRPVEVFRPAVVAPWIGAGVGLRWP